MQNTVSRSAKTRADLTGVLSIVTIAVAIVLLVKAASLDNRLPDYWTNSDLANYWVAGKLLVAGKAMDLFRGQEVYFTAFQSMIGPHAGWRNWSYPPHYLLLIAPLGLLDYLPAAILFLSVTLLLLLHALRMAMGRISWRAALLLLPALWCNLEVMQNGFLTAALLIYGLGLRDRHPVAAGIAIGILTVKPQLGFLILILLIYERRWMVMAVASMTAVALIGLSMVLFGVESWEGYLTRTLPYQSDVMLHVTGSFPHMIPSLFGSMRSLAFEPHMALHVHLVFAALALGLYLYTLPRMTTCVDRMVSTVFATFMISPYSVSYDLVALSAAVVIRGEAWARDMGKYHSRAFDISGVISVLLLLLLPVLVLPLGLLERPISPLIILISWVFLISSQAKDPSQRGTAAQIGAG